MKKKCSEHGSVYIRKMSVLSAYVKMYNKIQVLLVSHHFSGKYIHNPFLNQVLCTQLKIKPPCQLTSFLKTPDFPKQMAMYKKILKYNFYSFNTENPTSKFIIIIHVRYFD